MKKSFLWLFISIVVITFSSAYLAGCSSSKGGGGDGGGGVGGVVLGAKTFNRGIVSDTANGKISVNGIGFDSTGSAITVNGNPGTSSDIKPGQVVTMRGNAASGNGTATQIDFMNEMTGPVSGISGTLSTDMISAPTMTVFGQTVRVDGNTVFEPADLDPAGINVGSVVEVSGFPNEEGEILATFIESKATATEYNIRGLVSGVSGST
jgi:hypothetical protein